MEHKELMFCLIISHLKLFFRPYSEELILRAPTIMDAFQRSDDENKEHCLNNACLTSYLVQMAERVCSA